jgi:hypothetical protein
MYPDDPSNITVQSICSSLLAGLGEWREALAAAAELTQESNEVVPVRHDWFG